MHRMNSLYPGCTFAAEMAASASWDSALSASLDDDEELEAVKAGSRDPAAAATGVQLGDSLWDQLQDPLWQSTWNCSSSSTTGRQREQLLQQQQQQQQQLHQFKHRPISQHQDLVIACEDEGFLDDSNADDAVSIASEGSEILQLVDQILQGFNDEVAAAAAAERQEQQQQLQQQQLQQQQQKHQQSLEADLHCWQPMSALGYDWHDAFSDTDFCDLPRDALDSFESDCCSSAAASDCELLDTESVTSLREPAVTSSSSSSSDNCSNWRICSSAAGSSSNSVSNSNSGGITEAITQLHKGVISATAVFNLPQESVTSAMQSWNSLDRLRHEMWSSSKRLPRPDKSRRACSFLLRGCCRKEDCEFAHDLTKVTCKFWASGECFKGSTCPFLHGYAD